MTNNLVLERHFARIGARARVHGPTRPRLLNARFVGTPQPRIDVQNDRNGEVFDLELPPRAEATVLNSDPANRHLLLLVKIDATKSKFLCGHDERHWFAAAIPESASVGTVRQAQQALQPNVVRERAQRLPLKKQLRRHNTAYQRQGEWFFVPAPDMAVPPASPIHRDEPLTRGRGKPHVAQFVYRSGGRTVYQSGGRVLEQQQFNELPDFEKKKAWRVGTLDAAVYAKGLIRHPDHATLRLDGWCQVFPNTESAAQAMRQLYFID